MNDFDFFYDSPWYTNVTLSSAYKERTKTLRNMWMVYFKDEECSLFVVEKLIRHIEESNELQPSSKVAYFNVLKLLIRSYDPCFDLIEYLTIKTSEFKKIVNEREKDNTFDGELEANRWMSWEMILCIFDKLKSDVKWMIRDDTIITQDKYEIFIKYFILSLYVHWEPLRLDYGDVRLFFCNAFFKELKEKEFENYNKNKMLIYIPSHIGKSKFVLLYDKVSHKKGSHEREIPEVIYNDIITYMHLFGWERQFLFTKSFVDIGTPLDINFHKPNLKKLIYNIEMNNGEKSKLCVDTIRSAFITHLFNKPTSMNEKERVAFNMRTSVTQMLQSYYKIF